MRELRGLEDIEGFRDAFDECLQGSLRTCRIRRTQRIVVGRSEHRCREQQECREQKPSGVQRNGIPSARAPTPGQNFCERV
jgi:hypothetical protein